jgi:hypothetical protein
LVPTPQNTSESRPKIPGMFQNMVLEKDGEDHWGRSCEKLRSVAKSDRGVECPTNNKK